MIVRLVPLVIALSLVAASGCGSPEPTYGSRAVLTPGPEAGQYTLAFTVEEVAGGRSNLQAPRLTVRPGQEGSVSIADSGRQITCTALVVEVGGRAEADTTVAVEKNGRTVWSRRQTVEPALVP
jgi:hypothetical protein